MSSRVFRRFISGLLTLAFLISTWPLFRRLFPIAHDHGLQPSLCYAPAGTRLAELVALVGARWAAKDCFAEAKKRDRTRPLPGPYLGRLAPARHPVHAGARVPCRARSR
jgi:hypothetical protein